MGRNAGRKKTYIKLNWNEATIPPTPLAMERIEALLKEPSFFNLYPTTYND